MKLMNLFLTLAIVACSTAAVVDKCKQGPKYWCQNRDTATECGVDAFCKALKKTTTKNTEQKKETFHKTNSYPNDAPPVQVGFYYESLCPGCKEVWQSQLFPAYQQLKGSGIVQFDFVPYGNAQERQSGSRWQFYCQHGEAECVGNLIETCALHYYPNPDQHIPFLHCLEYYGPTATNGQYCASLSNMTYTQISTCANGDEGNSLEHGMATKTNALNPPHQYVPWLTLNGQPSTALASNMLQTICQAYTGTKPAACGSIKKNTACYKGQRF